MYKLVLMMTALLLAWPVSAQEKAVKSPPSATGIAAQFGVKDVLEMLNAKVPENLIVDMINKENLRLALTAQDLVALTKAGATERVLRQLDPSLAAPTRAEPSPPSTPADPVSQPSAVKADSKVGADPNDPDTPHKPGLYLFTEKNGERKLVTITKSVPQSARSKMQGILGYALFAFLPRAKASVHTSDRQPVLYLFVGETAEISGVVDSPGQLALVKMEHQTMQGLEGRRMLYAKQPHIGARVIVGTDPKAARLFKSEQTGPKAFRLIPDAELESGEYCFFFTSGGGVFPGAKGTAGSNVTLWDFGID
jgi:hypothetical protein